MGDAPIARQRRVERPRSPAHRFRVAREAIIACFPHAPSELPSINVGLEVPLEEFYRQLSDAASAIPAKVNSRASDS
jgi:hypothetical protein